jgi:hypothetical protein
MTLLLLAAALAAAPPADLANLSDVEVLKLAEESWAATSAHAAQPGDPVFLQLARCYEELRRRGIDNPALNRNLGNAYLFTGDVPRAILAYRRGLREAPADRGLQGGLAFARSQVAYPSDSTLGRPPVQNRPPWLPRLATGWYLTLALLLHTLGWVLAARWWMTRRMWPLTGAIACFITAAVFLTALVAEELRARDLQTRPVVVITDDGVLLRAGNGLRYPAAYETPLSRGVEARLLFTRGDWLQIELSGGEVGWVPREYALTDDVPDLGALPVLPLQ